MATRLDIPDAAFQVKADYFDRPSRAMVAVIREFIERTGTPHLWPGHTHTKPTIGSRVTFLAKYGLPKSHRRRQRWAPCPCCTLNYPKYFRLGLIAWFPEEGVIRCVGHDCYKKMDPEGYELAMNQLNAEIEDQRTAEFLVARIPRIPDHLRVLNSNLPPLEAIDDMCNRLMSLLSKTFAIDLWPEAKTGTLRYVVMRKEIRRSRNGEQEEHTFADFENYGAIRGHIALKPGSSRFAARLRGKMSNLGVIDFGSEVEARIATMTETEKQAAVKILTWGHKESNRICAQAEEARRFFSQETVATINGWAQQEGCSTRIHLMLDGEGLHIARRANESHSLIRWPKNFWTNIRSLDPLSQAQAA
jgi:hypothetical protein